MKKLNFHANSKIKMSSVKATYLIEKNILNDRFPNKNIRLDGH